MNHSPLPSERDFDPHCGDLDAQYAWKNFGGLTLQQAITKFKERPDIYQEDFMFMGGKAFAFYFPVIEHYLCTLPPVRDGYRTETWILAHCIEAQFDATTSDYVLPLARRVVALSKFVLRDLSRFGDDAREQKRISKAWEKLKRHIESLV